MASALSPRRMEAPLPTDTTHTNRTLQLYTLMTDGEGEVVQTVASTTHLPDVQFPDRRALPDQGQDHDTGSKELFDTVTADQTRAFDDLSSDECRAANVLQ